MRTSDARVIGVARPALVAALALAVAGVAWPGARTPARVDVRAALSPGSLVLESSAPGAALVTAHGLRPGTAASGAVRLKNAGSLAGELQVSLAVARERAGSGGGRLSEALSWTLEDASGDFAVSGPAGATIGLGPLVPGQARDLRIRAELPASAGNVYQGGEAIVDLNWLATAAGSAGDVDEPTAASGGSAAGSFPSGSTLGIGSRPRAQLVTGPFRWRLTRRGARLSARVGCTLPPCGLRAWGWISIDSKRVGWGMAGDSRLSASASPAPIALRTSVRGARVLRRAQRRRQRVVATMFVRVTARDGSSWLVTRRVRVFPRRPR